jgi:flagellin
MTRINTNVSSLVAQKTLQRSNSALQESLTRLSTGLRINKGKDDPAGLIASEVLRSDIISVQKAITNSERANQLIGTADSALGQVSSLLNDIRGLVSEAANTGALSDEQIAANQLQIDSSLEAIDRISQTTSFQGRRLLDGSLDFLTTGTTGVNVGAQAQIGTADANATTVISGGNANGHVTLTAKIGGTAFNTYEVSFTTGATAGSEVVTIDSTAKTVLVQIDTGATTAAQLVSAIQNDAVANTLFTASASGDGTGTVVTTETATTAGGVDGSRIIITAATAGPSFNGVVVNVTSGTATAAVTFSAATGGGGELLIAATSTVTAAAIASAITAEGTFTATLGGNGLGTYSLGTAGTTSGGTLQSISDLNIDQANFGTADSISVDIEVDSAATKGTVTYSGGTLTSDLILEIGGSSGFETFNFGSGTTISQIEAAINLVSDATGVTALVSGNNLALSSSEYGSNAFVSARALAGSFTTKDAAGSTVERDTGSDVQVRINGVQATGDGLKATLNTSILDLNFSINELITSGSSLSFDITGGGANFQIGPDVVSNQQARLGIQGVSTSTLGGVSGNLYELKSGGAKSLLTDVKGAAAVVDEVIKSVTQLRGRLGAFQRTTLETNIYTLNDTLENLTEAESSIRDADFAAESARLTRAQILVQSGTSVLAIANSNPQNVLSLLRG